MTEHTRPAVHVIAPSPAGGAESVVLALAAAAPDRTRVIILDQTANSSAPGHPLATLLRQRGVEVDEVRCGRRRYRAEARLTARLLAESKAALVHAHGYHATIVGLLAARRVGIPAVATVHGYLRRNLKERLYNLSDRLALRWFDATIAVSQSIHHELVAGGIRADRVYLIENGIASVTRTKSRKEARTQLGVAENALVVGWVGRLSPEKGADLFLQCMHGGLVPGVGVLIGDGPELPRLAEMVRSDPAGFEGRIRFAGQQPEAAGLLSAFDVLAVTSRTEGTPMVILEAVAADVPVVAFRVGGIPNVLDEDIAWLAPPEDVPALQTRLREALLNPVEAHNRAALARARLMERLGMDRWLDRIWRVYANVLTTSQH